MATRLDFSVMLLWGVPIAGLVAVGVATNFVALAVSSPGWSTIVGVLIAG
ncbi:MAG TPA: hypothetical protein VMV78_09350 [Thiobacillus sp.]|jgi:type IV secretory pathway VirB3-like protein|nr:hypothetical protein [Thiobacillus sp.]